MTVQKSFKRLVRSRMAKTGESYTAARAQLLAGATAGPGREEIPWLACPDERIRERTGRGWEEWFALLDSWGAESMGHTELAKRVADELGIHPLGWNAQAVTTSFERSRGMRDVGQRVGADGFVTGASKTIAARAEDVFMAFVDPSQRAGWLPGIELSPRTVTKPKSARFDLGDGPTRLFVTVAEKGSAKATVTVEQSRLADGNAREEAITFWRAALVTLKTELEQDVTAVSGDRR
ncbi:MAG: hypothetical protein ACRDY6_07190 [Acidimicrobiia bacterium]